MRRNLSIVIVLLFFQTLHAQKHPWVVKFSHEIEKGIAEGNIQPTKAATLYSLIGDYLASSQYSDIAVSWGVDTLNLETCKAEPALAEVVSEASKHQIVIISENHYKPQHRIFASKIITELSQLGFHHLGLETFSRVEKSNALLDLELMRRGYPLNSPLTGVFTMEPLMGELVRSAIQLKYTLFAYERNRKIEGKDRDEIQADNIIKYLNANPNEKIIILCGLYHAIESDMLKKGKYFHMAKHIKDKIGIDPLTIYQDNFTEKFIKNEHPLLNEIKIDAPSVLLNKAGELVTISKNVDLEILHPKTTYHHNRPDWLFDGNLKSPVEVDREKFDLNYPNIVSAYLPGEVSSVPVDRIELKHKYDGTVLVLKPGVYRITLYDGENEHEYEQIVE